MPRTPTGKPPGRPRVDRSNGSLWKFDVSGPNFAPSYRLVAPAWWLVMADAEARWRAEGTWLDRGSPKQLQSLLRTRRGDADRSKASVSEARNDPRYRDHVQRLVKAYTLIRKQDRERALNLSSDEAQRDADFRTALRRSAGEVFDQMQAEGRRPRLRRKK